MFSLKQLDIKVDAGRGNKPRRRVTVQQFDTAREQKLQILQNNLNHVVKRSTSVAKPDDLTRQAVPRRVSSLSILERRPFTVDGSGCSPAAMAASSSGFRGIYEKPSRSVSRQSSKEVKVASSVEPTVLKEESSKIFREAMNNGSSADKAALFASKYRLQLSEVREIMDQLRDGSSPSEKEFSQILCKIFGLKNIPDHVLSSAYNASKTREGTIVAEKFISWYTIHMFEMVNALTADQDSRSASDSLVYELARKYGVDTMVVDKVKHKFDSFDLDGSGQISYDEFRQMMAHLMRVKSIGDLSEARSKAFFKEIDTDGSGEIDFMEFTDWYLKYFNPADGEGSSPVENFYSSFNPIVQRRNTVARLEDHL